MIAKEAKTENIGICGKCGKEKDLTQKTKANGEICESCFLEKFQIDLPLDEYTLQPDERTKEQVAEELQCSTRYVEILKKDGKIAAVKMRRRVDGVVRSQLIFKTKDIENYKKGIDEPRAVPILEKTNANEQTGMQTNSPEFAFNFVDMMNQFAAMTQPRPKSLLMELSGKIFIGVEELAQFSGIAKSRLEIAIKDAEEKGVLSHFTGERGKSVYKCAELDLLIENLPPTPKQLPPKKKPEDA